MIEQRGQKNEEKNDQETAVLAAGCFWCVEAVFQRLRGVFSVTSGYSGGAAESAVYDQVKTGQTGHAEAVKIIYDPAKISYRQILEVFFAVHDPTSLNRQGYDTGPQYRSAIFFNGQEQKQIAQGLIGELDSGGVFERPIVTQLAPLTGFYPAEEEHLDFYNRNPLQPYCQAVINPKLSALRQKFQPLLKP